MKLLSVILFIFFPLLLSANANNFLSKSQTSINLFAYDTWQLVPTTDSFGKETGEYTIGAVFEGQMSNSAVTNAELVVNAGLSDGMIVLDFYEYGRTRANFPDRTLVEIDVRKATGDVVSIGMFFFQGFLVDTGYLPGQNPLIYDEGEGESAENQLLELLLSEQDPITVRVDMRTVERHQSAVYIFDMDNTGLAELMQ